MIDKTCWAFDLDGVITGNPGFFSYLTYHLGKNENNNEIFIISWRDGSNEERYDQTIKDLENFRIYYDNLILAPRKFLSLKVAAFWKIKTIHEYNIDIWFDDELKIYQRDLNIPVDKLLPEVTKIWI